MTDEDYQAAQDTLIITVRLLELHDWAAFMRRINEAETAGIFLMAPVNYHRATARTTHIEDMAASAALLVAGFCALNQVVAP